MEHFQGVNDLMDPSLTPNGLFLSAVNARFDKGATYQRPGLKNLGTAGTGAFPLRGVGVWKLPTGQAGRTGADQSETRHLVVAGKTLDGHGLPCLGLWAARDLTTEPLTFSESTPFTTDPHDNLTSGLLQGSDRETYFAQMGGILYGVDGVDGMFKYDGGDSAVNLVEGLPPQPIQSATNNIGARIDSGGGWQINGSLAQLSAVSIGAQGGAVTPLDSGRQLNVIVNGNADGTWIVYDRGAGNVIDLTATAHDGIDLTLEWISQQAAIEQFRVHLVTSDVVNIAGGDPTTGQAILNDTNSATFDAPPSALNTWQIFHMPMVNIPAGILSKVRYFVLELTNTNPGSAIQANTSAQLLAELNSAKATQASFQVIESEFPSVANAALLANATAVVVQLTQALAQSSAAIKQTFFSFGSAWSPGWQDPGRRYYVLRMTDATGNVSLRGPATTVDIPDYPIWGTPATVVVNPDHTLTTTNPGTPNPQPTQPARQVLVIVNFTGLAMNTTLEVYRSLAEAAGSVTSDGASYYLVKTIAYADAAAQSGMALTYTFIDTVLETNLTSEAPIPLEQSPPQAGHDAPWFIVNKDTRLIFARSDLHQERVWASDIGTPTSVPDFPFALIPRPIPTIDEPNPPDPNTGRGGWADVGATGIAIDESGSDGDEIMGIVRRVDEILIFKRRRIFSWTFLAEGYPEETWKIVAISTPGTESTRSLCELPGGIVWLSEDGLFYLSNQSDQATEFPISRDIQNTIAAIPKAYRYLVSCSYDPINHLLLVSVPQSLPTAATVNIASGTGSAPNVIQTATAHGFATGDRVSIQGGQWSGTLMGQAVFEAVDAEYTVTVVDPTHVSLNGTSAFTGTWAAQGTIAPLSVNTALLVLDLRLKVNQDAPALMNWQHPFGAWAGSWNALDEAGATWKPAILFYDEDETFFLRADVGKVDRLLRPGVDAHPYTDWGTRAIASIVTTGWITLKDPQTGALMRGRKCRLLSRMIDLLSDNVGDTMVGTLIVRTRPGTVSHSYPYAFTMGIDTMKTLGTGVDGLDRLHLDLTGEAFQVVWSWSGGLANVGSVRFLGLTVGVVDLGQFRG